MSEEKSVAVQEETAKQVVKPEDLVFVTEKTVDLGNGKKYTLHKLKAGRYYEAQKVYLEWSTQVSELQQSGQVDTSIVTELLDENGKADPKKLEEFAKKQGEDVAQVLKKVEKIQNMVTFQWLLIEIGLGKNRVEIEEEFYPEEIGILLAQIVDINNFTRNLKNSVAPIGGMAAMNL